MKVQTHNITERNAAAVALLAMFLRYTLKIEVRNKKSKPFKL